MLAQGFQTILASRYSLLSQYVFVLLSLTASCILKPKLFVAWIAILLLFKTLRGRAREEEVSKTSQVK